MRDVTVLGMGMLIPIIIGLLVYGIWIRLKSWDERPVSFYEKRLVAKDSAIVLMQKERDELNKLYNEKEVELKQLRNETEQIKKTLQSEVTKMNEQRQGFNQEVSRLNKIILKNKSK